MGRAPGRWGVWVVVAAVPIAGLAAEAARSGPPRQEPETRREDSAPSAPSDTELDRLIAERMHEAGMVGLAGALLVDGKVVWTKGYGYADREAGRPFTPDTVMNVGSISKTVVGVALLRAVEEGKLRLDDDIDAHLPFSVRNPRHPDVPITLRQLATHTSGIADRDPVYVDSYHRGGDSPVTLADFLREYFEPKGKNYSVDNFVAARPGSSREYSNIGAGLAAHVVERATGVPFADLTRDAIFRPLRMNRTGWFLSDVDRMQHARLYDASGGSAVQIPLYGLATWPDGGLRTSVADLSRFFRMLLGGGELDGASVLTRTSVDEMLRLQYTAANRPENVRLEEKNSGIFWSTKMDVTFVGHGGNDPGVLAQMLAEPSKRVAVVLLTNTTPVEGKVRAFHAIFHALVERGRRMVSSSGTEPPPG